MTTRSVRIPDEIDTGIVRLAETMHISVNSLIVQAAEELIARRAQEAAVAEASEHVFTTRAGLFERLSDA